MSMFTFQVNGLVLGKKMQYGFLGIGFFLMSMMGKGSTLFEWELLNVGGIMVSLQFYFDSVGCVFVCTVLTICLSVCLFSSSYMSGDPRSVYFYFLIFLFVGSMVWLILSPHMLMLMVGWDGLGLSSYLLVIYYMNDRALSAGALTILTNRVGDVLLLLSCCWVYLSGHFMFYFSWFSGSFGFMLFLVMASMTKSAQFPFSAWLPAAMAAPTPVSALVHSSTLVTAGVYLLVRFYSSMSVFSYFHLVLLFLGFLTCSLAGLAAMFEMDLKKMIALSTMSQLGVMVFCLGLGEPKIAFLHLIAHAMFKALLFICAGVMIGSLSDNQDIRLMGGLSLSMPLTGAVFSCSNLALSGFPFLSGFYSKDAILETFFVSSVSMFLGMFVVCSVTFTSCYMLRLSAIMMSGPFKGCALGVFNDENLLVKMSYSVLLFMVLVVSPFLMWFIMPVVQPLVLPSLMKFSILGFAFFFGMSGFMLCYVKLPFYHFGSSLWYLNFISSLPMVFGVFCLNRNMLYSEMTFMELMGGTGAGKVMNSVKIFQLVFGGGFLSLFLFSIFFLCWLVC